MLVPGSWAENCAYINHSGKEIESSQVVLLEKKPKYFWLQLQAPASHTPHQAGQVWEARAPNPGALLESIPIASARNGLKHSILAIPPPPRCSSCPYPQKLMGSAHFCNLYSLGSDMTCVFLH